MNYPPLKRTWYMCPKCGAKLLIYDNTASCKGVYIKCKKCKSEIEIVLHM